MPYGDVAGLSAYAAQNGYTVAVTPALLSRASRFLDALYGSLFIGEAISADQAWPRTGVPLVGPTEIPLRVIEATYELAIMEGTTPGTFNSISEGFKRGPVIRQKAGEVERAFADPTKAYGYSAAENGRPAFINGLLSPFLAVDTERPMIYVV